ncbi:sugar-binding transcriptional regulator [Enterococcus faecalis]|nr:sugar-binding transcriptional regulator [Enterococcus faecalis]
MYDREEILVKVASLFYESNKTQTQISKELGISRPTIASMLEEAREKEIVQIIISHPNKITLRQERILQDFFPDTQILVAPQVNSGAKEAVGLTTSKLLKSLLPTTRSVGLGWGTTLSEVVKAFNFTKIDEISFIPLIGGMINLDAQYHSNHLVSAMAAKLKNEANAEYLYAPALADNVEIKKHFEENSLVKSIISKAKKVDLALVGIGNPVVNSNYQEHEHISVKEIEELKEKHVIGDILTSFFTADGEVIESNISDRMIGLNIDDLTRIKTVIAVATGEEKSQSTFVTLKKKILNYLVVDEILADKLIELATLDENNSENN